MARCKRCVVKRRRKEEGKRRRKGGKNWGSNRKKKKKSVRIFSVCAVVTFGSIRNTLFRGKHAITTFVFMHDVFDEQIM